MKAHTFRNNNEFLVLEVAKVKLGAKVMLVLFFCYCFFCYRFNATKMLELIRGKRLVFVGDSINRNQWESMLCMLLSAVKDPKRVYEARGRKITKEKGNYSFRFLVILQNLTSFV
jgi:hypothetical protein